MSVSGPIAKQQSSADTDTSVVAGDVAAMRRDDFDRDVWCVMGLPIDAVDISRAVAEVDDAVRTGRRLSFVTPNVNFLARASKSQSDRTEILNADLSLADGAPLVMMARWLGVPIRSRVAGSDLFEVLRRRPGFAGRRMRVFFFGGRDGAAEKAAQAVDAERGGVEAVGWINPGFGDVESMSSDETIATINNCNPDFVLVALGAAKGQSWIDRNKDRLNAPVTAHLGAVVDFTAGGVARAPVWMQRAGLEWLWRIKEEPELWRRYARDALVLARLVLRHLPQRRALRAAASSGAEVRLEKAGRETVIRLSGVLRRDSLGAVREAFRQASSAGKSAQLDLTEVEDLDLAFLGQVLMLEKHLGRTEASISLRGAPRRISALFRANNMNYPNASGDFAADNKDLSGRRIAS